MGLLLAVQCRLLGHNTVLVECGNFSILDFSLVGEKFIIKFSRFAKEDKIVVFT